MKKNRYTIAALIVLAALTFIVYWNILDSELQFDDQKSIAENIIIKDIRNVFRIEFIKSLLNSGRPVTDITFALNYHYGRLETRGYHLINILLHIAVSIVVYFFVKKTIALSNKVCTITPELIALTVAFIFALHPINTQAVSYISQRAEILSTLFYLITLLLFIKSSEQRSLFKKSALYIVATIAFIFAIGSKTTAISLPFILLLYDYYFLRGRSFFDRIKLSGPLIIGGLIFAAFYLSGLGTSQEIGFSIKEITPSQYLLTQFKVILTYMRLLVLPVSQNLDYEYPISSSLFDIRTFLSMVFILCFIVPALIFRKKNRLISFGVLWFFLTLLPTSSIVPVRDVIFEHRVYLPSIGFFLSVSLLVINSLDILCGRYEEKIRHAVTAGIIILAVVTLAVATSRRNEVWKSRLALWGDIVSKSPGKPRAHYNLGHALLEKGLYSDAIHEFNTTLKCRDDGSVNRADIFKELGVTLFEMGRVDEAISAYRDGLRISPGHSGILNNLTIALMEKGRDDEALRYAEMALKIAPLNGDVHNSIGEIYFKKGEYTNAARHFVKAIEINPDISLRYWNAAITYEQLGNIQEAYRYMSMYISVEKNDADRKEAMIYMEGLKKKNEQ